MTDGLPDAVQRLAAARQGESPFLLPHHVEAARRLASTFERGQIRQRVTMSYDPTRVGESRGAGGAGDISAMAADARRTLLSISRSMPRECWNALLDVCALDRGIQETELEQGWPRRGGKLVLRIALSQLALFYGLETMAEGKANGRSRNWILERPAMFPETDEVG